MKGILRYLAGAMDYGLSMKWSKEQDIVAFADADLASNLDDRKLLSGFCVLVGGSLVSWSSKK